MFDVSEDDKTKVLWWVIAALLGSVGLNQGINKGFQDVRHDPFTGSQGKILRTDIRSMEHRVDMIDREQWRMIDRMQRREDEAEKCRELLDGHMRKHP